MAWDGRREGHRKQQQLREAPALVLRKRKAPSRFIMEGGTGSELLGQERPGGTWREGDMIY